MCAVLWVRAEFEGLTSQSAPPTAPLERGAFRIAGSGMGVAETRGAQSGGGMGSSRPTAYGWGGLQPLSHGFAVTAPLAQGSLGAGRNWRIVLLGRWRAIGLPQSARPFGRLRVTGVFDCAGFGGRLTTPQSASLTAPLAQGSFGRGAVLARPQSRCHPERSEAESKDLPDSGASASASSAGAKRYTTAIGKTLRQAQGDRVFVGAGAQSASRRMISAPTGAADTL